MIKKQTKGYVSELCTMLFLILRGYRIIGRNKCIYGVEIDILASHKGALVAVEVKFRQSTGKAHYSIHPNQQERQRKVIESYALRHGYNSCRIDAVFITPKYPFIEHIINAY